MSSHWRVFLFCLSLMAAPWLWGVGQRLGGDVGGWLLAGAVVAATAVYAEMGQPKPPAGTKPV